MGSIRKRKDSDPCRIRNVLYADRQSRVSAQRASSLQWLRLIFGPFVFVCADCERCAAATWQYLRTSRGGGRGEDSGGSGVEFRDRGKTELQSGCSRRTFRDF